MLNHYTIPPFLGDDLFLRVANLRPAHRWYGRKCLPAFPGGLCLSLQPMRRVQDLDWSDAIGHGSALGPPRHLCLECSDFWAQTVRGVHACAVDFRVTAVLRYTQVGADGTRNPEGMGGCQDIHA